MSVTHTITRGILALSIALVVSACDESGSPSPVGPSADMRSISGTVVFEQTGTPAEGVDVILETWQETGMMMDEHWNQAQHKMTDSHGQFHFEYEHQPMHRYRVGVRDQSEWHMCDFEPIDEDGVVLVIPRSNP